jgi:branched-chain amino acid transport system substrate-binding protein
MRKMNKFIVAILCMALILAGCAPPAEKPLKIGAILPLTGPAAVWGENIRNGMLLAQEDLAKQGITVEVAFEDSQAKPDVGLTSYRKLKDIDGVNMVISAFSRVSVPLVPVIDSDKTPLMMTLVSAKGVAEQSPYSFRFYSNERQYVEPQFAWMTAEQYPTAAVLWINDDFGAAVHEVILEQAKSKGIVIVADEKYDPNSVDFRTQLTKIKVKNPSAVLFVGSVPPEVSNALKQMREMGITADFIENSAALASPAARQAAGAAAEGAVTMAFPFSLGATGNAFKQVYKQRFNADPNFGAAFGYDMVKLVGQATRGKTMTGDALAQSIIAVQSFESLNGPVLILPNGEINPNIVPALVSKGEIVAR